MAQTTEIYLLTALEADKSEIKVFVEFVPSEGDENLFDAFPLASSCLLAIFGIPWLVDLCLHLHMTFLLFACLSPSFPL